MKKVFLNKKLIEAFETDERYYEDLAREVGVTISESDEDVQVIFIKEEFGNTEGNPVLIDVMINKLLEMKKAGATHVSVDYHCDHGSFEIDAFKISQSSKEEIEDHLTFVESSKQLAKTLEIQRLEQQLKQLKNE